MLQSTQHWTEPDLVLSTSHLPLAVPNPQKSWLIRDLVSVAHFKSTLCRDKGELLRWVEAVRHSPSMCVMSVWPHYHRLLGNRLVGRVSGDSGSKRSHVRQSLRTLLLSHFVIEVTISCSLALATAQLPTFQQSAYPFSSPVPFLPCVLHLQPDGQTTKAWLWFCRYHTTWLSLFVLPIAISPDSVYQYTLQTAKQVIQDKIQVVRRSFYWDLTTSGSWPTKQKESWVQQVLVG